MRYAVCPQLLAPPVLLAILLAGASSCAPNQDAESEVVAGNLERQEAVRVRVLPVVRQEMQRALETTTVVEAERHVVIQPQTTGLVIQVLAEEGDEVERGAVLARLDQRDAQAQLDDARIALQEAKDAAASRELARRDAESMIEKTRLAYEQAKRDYERNEKARMISALEIERLKLAMDTADQDQKTAALGKDRAVIDERTAATAISRAQLAVERAEVALSHTEMRAPFDGVITKRTVQVGDNVGSAIEAFTITDLSDLRTVFYRPQRELGMFTGLGSADGSEAGPDDGNPTDAGALRGFAGIEVTATSEALPGHDFTGRIERISPNIDATSGSFRVTVRLDEESGGARLLPGMLLRLRLVTERHRDAITVSKRALRREGETTILFAAEDGLARRIAVEEGFSGDDYIEVSPLDGARLEPGMEIVVVGNRDLEDGKQLEISPWNDGLEESAPPADVQVVDEDAPAGKVAERGSEEAVDDGAEAESSASEDGTSAASANGANSGQ